MAQARESGPYGARLLAYNDGRTVLKFREGTPSRRSERPTPAATSLLPAVVGADLLIAEAYHDKTMPYHLRLGPLN